MKNTGKRIVQIAVSCTMLMTAVMPFSRIAAQETGCVLTAFAADNTADMVANPSKYFEYENDPEASGQIMITRYKGTDTVIRIPGTINGKKVSRIYSGMYSRFIDNSSVRNNITKVTIDYNIKTIDSFAFDHCDKLNYVSIPSSVTKIDMNAFSCCPKLKDVIMSQYVQNTASNAFTDCTALVTAKNVNTAKTLLTGGAPQLYYLNNSQITYYCGPYQEPYLDPNLKSFIRSNYEKMDNNQIIKDYERWYASYIVFGRLGLSYSMPESQRAAIIFRDLKNRVSYNNQAFTEQRDENGRITGYGPVAGYEDNKAHCAGSALWGTKTVCEGYAKALSLLFSEAGLTAYHVSTRVHKDVFKNGSYVDDTFGHAFNLVKIGSRYYIVDATEKFDLGFMSSPNKQYRYRNTDSVMEWEVSYYRGSQMNKAQSTYLLYGCTNSELGDVDGDGKVTSNDYTVQGQYLSGTQSQKDAILSRYGMSRQMFETLADADCNGTLNNSADSLALWNRLQVAQNNNLT